MGEAKRRRALGASCEEDRLPDFIFARDRAAEEAGGYTLAGRLLTDIPNGQEPSESDMQLIGEIIGRLAHDVQHDVPDLYEAGFWRDGVKPPDGLSPPFPFDAASARAKRFIGVAVRIDPNAPDGYLRLSDCDMAEIMRRH